MNNELIEQIKANVPLVYEAGYNKCLKENPPGATEEELQEKYEEGYNNGHEDGKTEGFEEGKVTEHDTLWDALQAEGRRTNYYAGFYGRYWTDKNFYPKYDMKPIDAYMMFRYNQCTELFDRLDECGVTLDFSECNSLQYCFANNKSTRIGVINASKSTNMHYVFYQSYDLKKIEKFIVSENTPYQSTTFNNCNNLEELYIEGTIGQQNFNVQWSKNLNTKSIVSIIEALSTETEGLTITISETAVNNMIFPFTSDRSGITYNSWSELESTKTNWTIILKDK